MVVVDGQRQPIVLDDSIGSGRVGVGGFAPGNAVDTTISRFRVWTPTVRELRRARLRRLPG